MRKVAKKLTAPKAHKTKKDRTEETGEPLGSNTKSSYGCIVRPKKDRKMGFLAWIAVIVFVAYVANAGYRAACGADADWIGDTDDDASSWDDDGFLDDDMLTSPVYAWMVGNIWHDPFEDDYLWASSSDDDFDWGSDDD